MGIMTSKDGFDIGLSMVLCQLEQAVKNYEDFLVLYGTCPDMTLVTKLKEITEQIPTHDREDELAIFKEVYEDDLGGDSE